ncbi:class I SAM-dependent methyltransferase [Marinicella rhabdoformis]|uniref:class I SAM-dependent methyltransferase n=1 Tax=Marinicella rhabdoformis TaxID=2580566 RepID=UPI0012AEBEED|nr:class I SAM-dependent methyltransferase [Marinicella rhabdoformis]
MSENTKLKFTGERFLPECQREIWYEHYHRYHMVAEWVEGKVVLDAACGEGYGSHILSHKADRVLGVDVSVEAIEHAKSEYSNKNLRFMHSDILALDLPENSVDVVVSFETIEHLAEHEQLLAVFKRVLKDDGMLIISTPDKAEYSDKTGFENEYHIKELYKDEFSDLIHKEFKYTEWFGQKLMFQSAIWRMDQKLKTLTMQTHQDDGKALLDKMPFNPLYFIVVASNKSIDTSMVDDCYGFTDSSESVYEHYNEMIREYISVAEKFVKLNDQQDKWRKHPIIGRCIRWFDKEK